MDHDEIAFVLREYRRTHHITQQALAAAIGVQQSSISEWESGAGRPRSDSLVRWASGLGLRLVLVPRERHG